MPFDSPQRWITFPGFNLLDVARFGLVSAYLRFSNPWRSLEKETADQLAEALVWRQDLRNGLAPLAHRQVWSLLSSRPTWPGCGPG